MLLAVTLNSFHIPHGNERINVIDGFVSVEDAMENMYAGIQKR
jgi:hypothetical protein